MSSALTHVHSTREATDHFGLTKKNQFSAFSLRVLNEPEMPFMIRVNISEGNEFLIWREKWFDRFNLTSS